MTHPTPPALLRLVSNYPSQLVSGTEKGTVLSFQASTNNEAIRNAVLDDEGFVANVIDRCAVMETLSPFTQIKPLSEPA